MSDLWRFNLTYSRWAALCGPINTANNVAVYGTPGIGAASKISATLTFTAADFVYGTDKLYVFGGQNAAIYSSELWFFDLSTNFWTSVSAGRQSYTMSNQYPGARYGHSFTAISKTPLFVMMHGYGYVNSGLEYCLSDIWVFGITSLN